MNACFVRIADLGRIRLLRSFANVGFREAASQRR